MTDDQYKAILYAEARKVLTDKEYEAFISESHDPVNDKVDKIVFNAMKASYNNGVAQSKYRI